MRLWVARPEPGAARTGARLAALGHAPLIAPVLTIRPTGAMPPPGPFDGLILTSANALDALPDGAASFRGIPVFAVGTRTAALAVRAGLGPVEAGPSDAAALGETVRRRLPPGTRLLHLAGAERKAEPAASLTEAGYVVETLVAYRAEAAAHLPEAVCAAFDATPGLDGALHYSRRSARIALRLAEAAGYGGAFRALRHYCLSEDVAAALDEAGIAAHFVASQPREDSLLAGLSDTAGRGSHRASPARNRG